MAQKRRRRRGGSQLTPHQTILLLLLCAAAAFLRWYFQPEPVTMENIPDYRGAAYVELNENKCEGMIPVRDLDDDYYEFDEKNYCLRGRRKNRIYSLGDAITVKVARANLEKKQLDFALV